MSSDKLALFTSLLSDNNYRVTTTRIALFNILVDAKPLSIQQIVQRAGRSIDRVSIYRNIELFESLGIVRRVTIGRKYNIELSEKFVSHHHHLVCLVCRDIIDIQSEERVEKFIDEIAKELSFKPTGHQFEIEGYCEKCHI